MSRFFVYLISLYQKYVSPGKPSCCRFTPSCSQYAKEAFFEYGAIKGGYLAVRRILRCHPFSGKSGYDPVKKKGEM